MRSDAEINAYWAQIRDRVVMEEIMLKMASLRDDQDEVWPSLEEMYSDLRQAEWEGDYRRANEIEAAIDAALEKEGQ